MEENRISEQSRLRFFSDAFVLSTLCRPSALERLSEILVANEMHGQWWATHVVRGYKLVIETALYGLLGRIIEHPEFLNMEGDSGLSRWWARVQGEDGTTINAAIRDPSSQLGQAVARLDHILVRLRQSVRPWNHFEVAAREAGVIVDRLAEVGLSGPVTPLDDHGGILDTQAFLKVSAIERLHDYINARELHMAFEYVHGEGSKRKNRPHGHRGIGSPRVVETSRDHIPRYFGVTHLPEDLGIGVLAAITVSLRELGVTDGTSEFEADAFRQGLNGSEALVMAEEVLESAGALQYPSMIFGLKSPQEIPAETISALGGLSVSRSPEDRLRVLLSGSTQLVGSRDYYDARRFEVLVAGLASILPTDSPIDVLQVVHTDCPGATASVSIGVYIPGPFGPLADHTSWWFFYRVYDLNRLEPANRMAHKVIEDVVRNSEGRIRVETVPEVPTGYLLDLIDSSALREENRQLNEQNRRLKAMNDKLRGAIPEMLSGLLLARTGYRSVRTSLKVRFPGVGERELDAVGVRSSDAGTECLIVEAKGRHDSQHNLMEQAKRLEEKIHLARSNGQLVGQTLGCDEPIAGFKGRFISMADLSDVLDYPVEDAERDPFSMIGLAERAAEVKEFLDGLVDIETWHYDRFKSELRKAGVAEDYIKLLERSVITWHVGSPE